MFGDVRNSHCVDVTVWPLPKVRLVCLLAESVPVTRKDTQGTSPFGSNPESTDATKQVNDQRQLWLGIITTRWYLL